MVALLVLHRHVGIQVVQGHGGGYCAITSAVKNLSVVCGAAVVDPALVIPPWQLNGRAMICCGRIVVVGPPVVVTSMPPSSFVVGLLPQGLACESAQPLTVRALVVTRYRVSLTYPCDLASHVQDLVRRP